MSSIMSSLMRRSARLPRIATKQHRSSSFHSSSSLVSNPTPVTKLSPSPSLFNPFRFASSSTAPKRLQADIKLSLVLQSEIDCAIEEKKDDLDQLSMGMPLNLTDPVSKGGLVPDGFPFEIIDIPGEDIITLKREFDGEKVIVFVQMPQVGGEEEENEDDDDKDKDDENDNSVQINMRFVVTVVKGDGPRLEFTCNASPTEFTIESVLMKEGEETDENEYEVPYEGPEFTDLDESLQKEFYGYLERRGIKQSLMNVLQEYMVDKDNREYFRWLKDMKEFVDK